MARPYESPGKKARRMRSMAMDDPGPASDPMDDGMQGGGAPPATEEPAAPEGGGQEKPDESFTAFLPKEITAGKSFKAGDEIVLKIKDIDPDTGELEVQYAPSTDQEQSPMDMMNSMGEDES